MVRSIEPQVANLNAEARPTSPGCFIVTWTWTHLVSSLHMTHTPGVRPRATPGRSSEFNVRLIHFIVTAKNACLHMLATPVGMSATALLSQHVFRARACCSLCTWGRHWPRVDRGNGTAQKQSGMRVRHDSSPYREARSFGNGGADLDRLSRGRKCVLRERNRRYVGPHEDTAGTASYGTWVWKRPCASIAEGTRLRLGSAPRIRS
jgi:hypothetical protein